MLKIEGLDVFYGAIQALDKVSLHVDQGEVVSIIGSNGAGKSTLLRTISGLIRPRTGTIEFEGHMIHTIPPDKIVQMGIGHSPEGRRIFTNMTVAENLMLGAFTRKDGQIKADMDKVMDRFPRVRERLTQNAGTIQSQMVRVPRTFAIVRCSKLTKNRVSASPRKFYAYHQWETALSSCLSNLPSELSLQ